MRIDRYIRKPNWAFRIILVMYIIHILYLGYFILKAYDVGKDDAMVGFWGRYYRTEK